MMEDSPRPVVTLSHHLFSQGRQRAREMMDNANVVVDAAAHSLAFNNEEPPEWLDDDNPRPTSTLQSFLWCNILLVVFVALARGLGITPSLLELGSPDLLSSTGGAFPFCNKSMFIEVLPHTSLEGTHRLQHWIYKRSVPWQAMSFVMPHFHPNDAEAQVVPVLPTPLLKMMGPAWTCVPQHPHLHALWCTWTPCVGVNVPIPTNKSEWQSQRRSALQHVMEQLERDATVIVRPHAPSAVKLPEDPPSIMMVQFDSVLAAVPEVCFEKMESSSFMHTHVGCWEVHRETWFSDFQALWRWVVALRQRGSRLPHTIVWPHHRRWWDTSSTPSMRHSFSILQRLTAIGITQVVVGEPESPIQSTHMLQVQVAPSVGAVSMSKNLVEHQKQGEDNALIDHTTTPFIHHHHVLWIKNISTFFERLHSVQTKLQSSRRRGLGVACAQLQIVEAHCEECFGAFMNERALWDSLHVDVVVPFLTAMQC